MAISRFSQLDQSRSRAAPERKKITPVLYREMIGGTVRADDFARAWDLVRDSEGPDGLELGAGVLFRGSDRQAVEEPLDDFAPHASWGSEVFLRSPDDGGVRPRPPSSELAAKPGADLMAINAAVEVWDAVR